MSENEIPHFLAPFPWNSEDWKRLIELFKTEDALKVTWWWEPYHRVGFQALSHSASRKIDGTLMAVTTGNLSCVAPPAHARRKFQNRGLLDEDGRVVALDPQAHMRRTLAAAGEDLSKFSEESSKLPTIQDLRRELAGYFESWMPQTKDLEEFATVSNWLTKGPELVKRFHDLGRWEQLELLETLVGPLISSSDVNFVRVYLKS